MSGDVARGQTHPYPSCGFEVIVPADFLRELWRRWHESTDNGWGSADFEEGEQGFDILEQVADLISHPRLPERTVLVKLTPRGGDASLMFLGSMTGYLPNGGRRWQLAG